MTTLSTRNIGKAWTKEDISQLKELAKEKRVPLRIICLKLGRSPNGVRAKASEKGISLRRTNPSP
jgi:hypothetical protein